MHVYYKLTLENFLRLWAQATLKLLNCQLLSKHISVYLEWAQEFCPVFKLIETLTYIKCMITGSVCSQHASVTNRDTTVYTWLHIVAFEIPSLA